MRSKRGKPINVAKVPLYWRIYAWGVLVLYLPLLQFYLVQVQREGMRENFVGLALVLGVLCLCLYAIVRTHCAYRWNDEEIRHTGLLGSRSIRWDEVVRFDVVRWQGSWTRVILHDSWGKRLTLYTFLLREDSRLHAVLREKLAHLEERWIKEIEDAGEARFPVRFPGWPTDAFIVRGDTLIHKSVLKKHEISLPQVHEVSPKFTYDEYGGQRSEVTELLSRDGKTIEIPSATKGYDKLVAYIRAHATNAAWVSADMPKPPHAPGAVPYARRDVRLAYEYRRATFAAAVFAAGVAVDVLYVMMASREQPSRFMAVGALLQGLLLATVAAATVWWTIRYKRELKQMEDAPNASARDKEQTHDSQPRPEPPS